MQDNNVNMQLTVKVIMSTKNDMVPQCMDADRVSNCVETCSNNIEYIV